VPHLATNHGDPDPEGTDAGALLELLDEGRPEWMSEGLCRSYPEITWFPESGQSTAAAREVCARCPVKAPCLDYGRSQPHIFGIWGGAVFTDGVARQSQRKPGRPSRRDVRAEFDAVMAEAEAWLARDTDMTQNPGQPGTTGVIAG
jgi:hypothetical protein